MRKLFIAGNWKMYKNAAEAVALAAEVKKQQAAFAAADVALCPPFTALGAVGRELAGSAIAYGAQNMHWEGQGAYTGEISPRMLVDLGCRYVIIGHSERRQYFGETNENVNKKLAAAFAHGILPIMCIGETLQERNGAKTLDVLKKQLTEGLRGLSAGQITQLTVAYEPIWAIGTGVNATPQQAQEAHHFIRGQISSLFDPAVAEAVRIQYGGSVKPENAAELMSNPDVDGALVGGASLKSDSFAGIILNGLAGKKA